MKSIDLNCDLGEAFGAWRMGNDEALLPLVSSVNIACGFHAGDPQIMRATVALAVHHGVAIGAHVALPDLQGFGRRNMAVSADETYALTLYQIGALHGFAAAAGSRLAHVKPHGALYNMAARERSLADAIAAAVHDFNPALRLVGLAGSALLDAARARGLPVAGEAFVDRRYLGDGSLQSRREAGAVLDDPAIAVAQGLAIAREGEVHAADGSKIILAADTLCLHGDGTHAVALAAAMRAALIEAGLSIQAPGAA